MHRIRAHSVGTGLLSGPKEVTHLDPPLPPVQHVRCLVASLLLGSLWMIDSGGKAVAPLGSWLTSHRQQSGGMPSGRVRERSLVRTTGRRWARCSWSEWTRRRGIRRVKATVREGAGRTLEHCGLAGHGLNLDGTELTCEQAGASVRPNQATGTRDPDATRVEGGYTFRLVVDLWGWEGETEWGGATCVGGPVQVIGIRDSPRNYVLTSSPPMFVPSIADEEGDGGWGPPSSHASFATPSNTIALTCDQKSQPARRCVIAACARNQRALSAPLPASSSVRRFRPGMVRGAPRSPSTDTCASFATLLAVTARVVTFLHDTNISGVDVKSLYTKVDFAVGSQFTRHVLDDSEPIADLQENITQPTLSEVCVVIVDQHIRRMFNMFRGKTSLSNTLQRSSSTPKPVSKFRQTRSESPVYTTAGMSIVLVSVSPITTLLLVHATLGVLIVLYNVHHCLVISHWGLRADMLHSNVAYCVTGAGAQYGVTHFDPPTPLHHLQTTSDIPALRYIPVLPLVGRSPRLKKTSKNFLVKAVHDKVSTFEINLRKKNTALPAYILTGAMSVMSPVNVSGAWAYERAPYLTSRNLLYMGELGALWNILDWRNVDEIKLRNNDGYVPKLQITREKNKVDETDSTSNNSFRVANGAAVVQWLECHLPPRRTVFDSRRGHPPISARGNRAERCRWSAGLLGDLPLPPPTHSGAAPYSSRLTLIGSQDLTVKSRPNLFTHSLTRTSSSLTEVSIRTRKLCQDREVASWPGSHDKIGCMMRGNHGQNGNASLIVSARGSNENYLIAFPAAIMKPDSSTLSRHSIKFKDCEQDSFTYSVSYAVKQVFADPEEESLVDYIQTVAKMQYGLRKKSVRQLAYKFAKANETIFPETWDEE
ncbi:hypothetical protein PR048_001471 [Dryococelus australis]|uniref:Uncharacterized protein n=1 Tax=Dryococelus australis TaxID=614101 RepID=A0ABQ9IHG1_9NEOP|nr:hypothetical protein PR048_001471 [Dryococelus australis]